jgi:hypothetical protein
MTWTSYRMSLISTGFISLDSTFNSKLCKATYTIFSVLYMHFRGCNPSRICTPKRDCNFFWHVRVAITSLVFPGCSAGKGSYLPHVTSGMLLGTETHATVLPRCGRIRQYDGAAILVSFFLFSTVALQEEENPMKIVVGIFDIISRM